MTLTHLQLPFEIKFEGDPRKAPKGKLPYIDIDGEVTADSELILQKLDQKFNGAVYGELSPKEIAVGRAFTRLCEEHLYWMIVASRWLEVDWFPNIVSGFFSEVPAILRSLIAKSAQSKFIKTYNLQGLGRHTKSEQQQFGRHDLAAISDQIEAERYITGGRLTVFDFNVASILAGLMDNEPATWISILAQDYPVLREYVDRVQRKVGIYAKGSEL